MRLLILPGNSIRNKAWSQDLQEKIAATGVYSLVDRISYGHRESAEPSNINFEDEVGKVHHRIEQSDEPYAILGKSAGALLFFSDLGTIDMLPEHVTICGFPLRYCEAIGFTLDTILQPHPFPVTVIQHSHDPEGSYDEVSSLIHGLSHRKVIEIPGKTHHYDAEEIISHVVSP